MLAEEATCIGSFRDTQGAPSVFTRQLTSRTVAEIELPGTSWGFLGGNLIYI